LVKGIEKPEKFTFIEEKVKPPRPLYSVAFIPPGPIPPLNIGANPGTMAAAGLLGTPNKKPIRGDGS
jgi:hypothetical protein